MLKNLRIATLTLAAGLILVISGNAQTPAPVSAVTYINVPEMECNGCAGKLSKRLKTVPGVAVVQTDVNSDWISVTPQPGAALSPKQLWEAIEQAGKTPTKLQGPNGEFTALPQY